MDVYLKTVNDMIRRVKYELFYLTDLGLVDSDCKLDLQSVLFCSYREGKETFYRKVNGIQ